MPESAWYDAPDAVRLYVGEALKGAVTQATVAAIPNGPVGVQDGVLVAAGAVVYDVVDGGGA